MERLRATSRALTPPALTILRVVFGFVMAVHGWLKLADFDAWQSTVAQMGVPAPTLLATLSTAAELVGGIGLVVGLLTPVAALAVLVNMIVAIFLVHLEGGLLMQNNGFEYPLILAALALFFLVRGAGPVSVDRAIFGRRAGEHERRRHAPFRREAPA